MEDVPVGGGRPERALMKRSFSHTTWMEERWLR